MQQLHTLPLRVSHESAALQEILEIVPASSALLEHDFLLQATTSNQNRLTDSHLEREVFLRQKTTCNTSFYTNLKTKSNLVY